MKTVDTFKNISSPSEMYCARYEILYQEIQGEI